MYEWSDEHQMVRDAIRSFVEAEIKPNLEELEHGDIPPYDTLRKLYRAFGLDAMAAEQFERRVERDRAQAAGEDVPERQGGGGDGGMMMIPIIELCRYAGTDEIQVTHIARALLGWG